MEIIANYKNLNGIIIMYDWIFSVRLLRCVLRHSVCRRLHRFTLALIERDTRVCKPTFNCLFSLALKSLTIVVVFFRNSSPAQLTFRTSLWAIVFFSACVLLLICVASIAFGCFYVCFFTRTLICCVIIPFHWMALNDINPLPLIKP